MAFGYNFTVTLLEEGKVILSKPIVINQGDKNCKINLEFKAENVLQDLTDKTLWQQKKYNETHVRSLLIKYASKLK